MNRIQRYIFCGGMAAYLTSLFGLTGIIWITQALREFDLLTTKGQSFWVFFGITGLGIPILFMVIAPIALFIAVIYVLNRLNGDSELVILNAAGFSPVNLLKPFAILAVIVALMVASLTLVIMPWSFDVQRDLVTRARADFLTRVIEPGQFLPLTDGFLFHYRERGPSGELLGIFMQDRRDTGHVAVYLAEVGRTVDVNGQNFLILEKGSVQRQDDSNADAAIVTFDRYGIDLAQFTPNNGKKPFVPRERSTAELYHANAQDPDIAPLIGRIRAEYHDRFINPLFAIAFALIGFAALGQPRTTRQGRGSAIIGAIAVVVAVRLGGAAASTMMLRQSVAVYLAYFIPTFTILLALAYIFRLRIGGFFAVKGRAGAVA